MNENIQQKWIFSLPYFQLQPGYGFIRRSAITATRALPDSIAAMLQGDRASCRRCRMNIHNATRMLDDGNEAIENEYFQSQDAIKRE